MRIKTETSVGLFILVAVGIFLYMSFQIGVWRLDGGRYKAYNLYFSDVAGLGVKAEVKIAGVTVGWVDDLQLSQDAAGVLARVMVLGSFVLHSDAYGLIRQDGLLGTKFVEIIPGTPELPIIHPGGTLARPVKETASIDTILDEVQSVAKSLAKVSVSLEAALGGDDGLVRLESAIDGFNRGVDSVARLAESLESVVQRNSATVDSVVSDLGEIIGDLKTELPQTTRDLRDSLAVFTDKIALLSGKFEEVAAPVENVMHKLTKSEGVLGSLISDENMGRDVRSAVQDVRRYFNRIDRLAITFDAHSESMCGVGNMTQMYDRLGVEDAKGFFNVLVHPTEDYFYQLGVVGSYTGTIQRQQKYRYWYDDCGKPIFPGEENLSGANRLRYAPLKEVEKRKMDTLSYNLQVGKRYNYLTFRGGLFESSFGVGVDFDLPLGSDAVRWVSSLEAYDLRGRNRVNDDRMHLKWINKVFFANTLCFTFGADDFVSRTNKNAFFGFGIQFSDDDVKYFASKLSLPAL